MKIIIIGITNKIREIAHEMNKHEMFNSCAITSFCGQGNQYLSSEDYLNFLGFKFNEIDLNEIDFDLAYSKTLYYNYGYFKDYYYIYNNETVSEVISRFYLLKYNKLSITRERLEYCYEMYIKLKKLWDIFFNGIGSRYLLKINFNRIEDNLILDRYLNNKFNIKILSNDNDKCREFIRYRGYL